MDDGDGGRVVRRRRTTEGGGLMETMDREGKSGKKGEDF